MKITNRQAAEKLGAKDVEGVKGLIKYLESEGIVTLLDEKAPAEGGKGRGQNVYEYDETTIVEAITSRIKYLET